MQKSYRIFVAFLVSLVCQFPGLVAAGATPDFLRFFVSDVGKLRPAFSYRFTWESTESVSGQATALGINEHELGGVAPLWQNGSHELAWIASMQVRDLDSRAILPQSGAALPGSLWDVRFGPSYRHRFANGWKVGGSFLFGSASDKPFASAGELEASFNAFLNIPTGEKNAWLVFLNYSNNREFLNNIPLPGFAYYWGGNRWFRGMVGVPILQWELFPEFPVQLAFTYFPARNIAAELRYKPLPFFILYSEFLWQNDEYFRNARTTDNFRLFYYEKRLGGGLRIRPLRWMELDLSGGFAFDRFFFEAKKFEDRRNNLIQVGDGAYFSAKAGFRF